MMAARKLLTGPRIIGALVLLAIAVAIFVALRTPPVEVELGAITRGPMTVTVDDLGETRVADMYVVSAPVSGQLLRVPLEEGDRVVSGQTLLARIQPTEPGPLDARTLAQTEANVRALQAQLRATQARVAEVRAERQLAELELARLSELAGRGFVSRAQLDRARATRDRMRASVAEAIDSVEAARQNLAAARGALITAGNPHTGRGAVTVTAPVSGYVMRVPQESERVVAAGTPLVEVGDPARLEMVTDLLSADAVRVSEGAPVSIEDWGGEKPLHGRVRRVEPYGFLKISALGVEEQRVNVVIDFIDPREAWQRLGHGYRGRVRITIWSARDVLRVPIGALFRDGGEWAVFAVGPDDVARLTRVRIGRMNDEEAQLLGGLSEGARIILHPGDRVEDRIAVEEI
jgi:HlyD family secretion protein